MTATYLLRALLALCVAAALVQGARVYTHAIDDAEQASYARSLKRLQTLDSALNEAVLRSRSGLLLQYDPLVQALAESRRLHALLRKTPKFLAAPAASALRRRLDEFQVAFARKENLVESFKSENSVVQTSLHYFPIIATKAVDRAEATPSGTPLVALIHALGRAVMLFETAADADARARALAAKADLSRAEAHTRALGVEREVGVAVAHASIILERLPVVDATVREVLGVPTRRLALRMEDEYGGAHQLAVGRNLAELHWLFALALAVTVLGLTEIILGMRHSASALEALTGELHAANEALAVAHEKQRQLAELRSRFIAMASHEFRTPLTGIASSAELLESFGERWDAERRRDHLERIRMGVGSMERIMEDVMTISRAEVGALRPSPSPIRLDEFCKRLVETLEHATKKSHPIKYTFLGDPDVTLDERLLQHVLGNLLGNAVKYSTPGSEIRFDVRTNKETCTFSIADRGIGIPPEEVSNLFASFSRASNTSNVAGSGLGLAVVKKVLDVQNGKVEVESTLGAGTTFRVEIPREPTQADITLT